MKILITYATAGIGHKKAAEAIYEEIKHNSVNEVAIIDSLDYTTCLFKFTYSRGYTFLISRLPYLWGFFYWLTNRSCISGIVSYFRNLYNFINSRKLTNFLIEQKPQIVISTHFFANQIISRLKESNHFNCRLICVITDFVVHSFWLVKGVNLYTVASKELKEDLISRGIEEDRIKVAGIPVKNDFLKPQDRQEVCKKLNIKHDAFTALIVMGAIGIGPIGDIVEALKNEVQIIVVCGRNKRLFSKLSKIRIAFLKVLGFVDNIHELMSVSDVIITKAGGLTISESLAKELPMILFNLIPGQETYNARLIESLGVGIITKNVKQIKDSVLRLRDNPQELAKMKENIISLAKPEAGTNILKLLSPH